MDLGGDKKKHCFLYMFNIKEMFDDPALYKGLSVPEMFII